MKKFVINYDYDKKDKMFVAVCPEFFGFILYCDSLTELKKESLRVLRIYTNNNSISANDIEFTERQQELEMGL